MSVKSGNPHDQKHRTGEFKWLYINGLSCSHFQFCFKEHLKTPEKAHDKMSVQKGWWKIHTQYDSKSGQKIKI